MMDRDPPDSSSDGQRRDLRAARLLGEYVDRVSQGETANVEEFLRGHPDISPEIEGELRLLVSLGTGAGEPRRFGDFEILREIGRGGMGIVYQARQVSLNRRVALKILPAALISDPRAVARFYREAKVAAILHHPNIVPVHAMGVESGTPFFVMELCEGETLRQALRRVSGLSEADGSASMATLLFGPAKGAPHSPVQTHFTPRSPSLLSQADEPCSPTPTKGDASGSTEQTYCVEVAGLFAGVAEGLQHAHDRKVIHRDLKPSNLILDLDGRLRILDFGLAWVADDQSLTLSSDRLGTPLYMSPEQARGDKDALGFATDIYSLGATLYEVLTWHPPFHGRDHREVLDQVLHREPVSPRRLNPTIPRDIETIVLKCMRKDPRDRYGTAEALAQDLRRFARGAPVEARPQALLERLGRRAWHSRRRIAGGTVLALLVVFLAVLLGVQWRGARQARLAEYDRKVLSALDGLLRRHMRSSVVTLGKSKSETSYLSLEGEGPLRRSPEPGGVTVLMRAGCELVDPPELDGPSPAVEAGRSAGELEKADANLRDAVSLIRDRPDARYHLARVLRELGRGEEAMASADEAIRVAPRFVPALAMRALLSREAGRGDAPELERRARDLAKGTWAESWLDARAAMEGGRWDAAASAYETLLARGSEGRGAYVGWEHEALVGAGIANLRSQNLERAIERLGGARSKFGSSIEIDLLLAKAYHLAGPGRSATRSDEVLIQRFRESRGSEADDIAAAAFEAYLDIGELRTAREWVGRLSPGAKQVQLRGRLLRSTGRVGPSADLESVMDGLELVRLGGNEPWIHVCLGNAYLTLRMFEEADRWFSKATDLAPRDPAPLVGLGVSAFLRGKLQEARRSFEAALGLDSGSVRAHYNLGVVLTDMGLDEEAEVQYASALGLDADHALSLNNRGVLLDGRGLLLDATQHYERAVRAAPLLDIPRYNLARALHRQGEYRRAAAEYREAIRLGGKQAIIHGNLANCLFHLRRLDEACVEYGLALSLDPQSARAHHGLGVTLIHLSRYEDALQPLSRAVQIESVWANARNDYASTLEEVGRSAEAFGQYKELVRNHPDFVHAYNNLASLILRERMQISDEGEQDELYRLFEDALHLPGADEAVDTLLAEWRRSLPFGRLTYGAIDAFLDPTESIVGEGSSWQYWDGPPLPFDDLSWTEDGFDDGSWKTGESGFASSERKGVGTVIGGGGGSDASLFLRRRFSVSDRARVRRLIFRVRSAGGWIVYLNGKECQRLLAGGPNLREGPQVTVVGADRPWVERRIHLDEGFLRDGENVLAIHALHPAGMSEFGVWPSLEAEVPFEGPARVRAEEALRLGRAPPHGPEEESRLIYLEAGILERSRDFAAAESLYRRVLAAETRRPEPALRVAACLEARGSSREAMDFLRQRLDLSRTSHLAMFREWLRLAMGAVGLAAEEVLGDLGQLPENPLPLVRDALWPLGELAAGNAVRINCGGLDFLEPAGGSWSHDRLFLGGVPFFLFRLEESGIELDAPHLYQTERFFPEPHPIVPGYEIPLPKGSYKVTLRFVEGHFTERGIRSFGVRVEGRDIADNLEPLGAGFGIPQSLERTVTVDDGALNIDFRRVLENPKISAIEVERI